MAQFIHIGGYTSDYSFLGGIPSYMYLLPTAPINSL